MRAFIALLLGIAVSAVGMTSVAPGATAGFFSVTYVELGAAATAQAAGWLRQYGQALSRAAGAVRVDLLERIERPGQFVIAVAWRDQAAFEAHQRAAAASELDAKLQPLLASPTDTRLHHALSVASSVPPMSSGAVYAVTHVDVVPPRKDDGVAALRRLVEDSRAHGGHVRFEVLQQTNRPNHFTVIEVWQDRAALDAHAIAPETRRFREQLAPMSGALYDERLYRALD